MTDSFTHVIACTCTTVRRSQGLFPHTATRDVKARWQHWDCERNRTRKRCIVLLFFCFFLVGWGSDSGENHKFSLKRELLPMQLKFLLFIQGNICRSVHEDLSSFRKPTEGPLNVTPRIKCSSGHI